MSRRHRLLTLTAVSTLLVGSTAAVAPPASAAAVGCSVAYTVQQWDGGFQGNVTITNLGSPVLGWTLTWSYTAGQTVTQGWNATVTQSGSAVTAVNASWDGRMATSGTASFGYSATSGSSNPSPTNFALDGVACNGSVTANPPAFGPLTQAYTAGRVESAGNYVAYTWPGIYFEGRFQGTGVGIVLNDSVNDYDVAIDGTTVASLTTPGQTTYWINSLTNGVHTVRLVKRTESVGQVGEFGGFVAAPGGAILSPPAAPTRQIEYIGDSYTAGYGNLSTVGVDCSSAGGVTPNSDADLSFGALTAKSLGADYQIIAQSGMGMVRNYDGTSPGTSFRTYYDNTLQAAYPDTYQNPSTWDPQLIVIGLGINDFSTPLNAGEQWTTTAQLVAAYETAYEGFIAHLRALYGPHTIIVVSATYVYNTTLFAQSAQQVVQALNSQGDNRVYYWYYSDPSLNYLGCDYHPSVHDDQIISGLLDSFIGTLPLSW
jgi:hypothetical protein